MVLSWMWWCRCEYTWWRVTKRVYDRLGKGIKVRLSSEWNFQRGGVRGGYKRGKGWGCGV